MAASNVPAVIIADPVDTRLLALVADAGRVAVHDLARHAGLDAREVAARLVALAATGLPLVVGVECDQAALRQALAGHGAQARPTDSPVWPQPNPPGTAAARHSTGQHPQPADGVSLAWGPPGSAGWVRGDSTPYGDNPHGDDPPTPTVRTTPSRRARHTGVVGDTLHADSTSTADGANVAVRLVEVVDPANFLYAAAGHTLQPGLRSVVVHTELTNRGTAAFTGQPDLHLVLLASDGQQVSRAAATLSSRPPHRAGIHPGETVSGHTVYVLPEGAELAAVRWSAQPDDPWALTWTVRD